ncbi:MAG: sigma factor [Christensenellales bacterium]
MEVFTDKLEVKSKPNEGTKVLMVKNIMNKWNYHNYEYAINENMYLVYLLVAKFKVSYQVRDDLLQAGFRGLIKAIRVFDLQKGCQFSKFAIPIILESIKIRLRSIEINEDEVVNLVTSCISAK